MHFGPILLIGSPVLIKVVPRSSVLIGEDCGLYSMLQRRTKKEVMEEVIAKSKYFKASFGFIYVVLFKLLYCRCL